MMVTSAKIYGPADLAMLTRVLEEALDASINGAGLAELQIQELSSRLGKVIMDRFTEGKTDPEILKRLALEGVQQR
jgi:hypothetical protein